MYRFERMAFWPHDTWRQGYEKNIVLHFQHIMPLHLTYSNYSWAHRSLNLAQTALPLRAKCDPWDTHRPYIKLWWSPKKSSDRFHRIHMYCFLPTKNIMSPSPRLSAIVFTDRQRTISVPSGHMSEFPRSSPISILLGCDTRPDVAAPLTSRVSLLTGCLDCSSQGQEGGVALKYRRGTPMMYTGSTPLLLSEQLS